MKLTKLKLNPDNPRLIKDEKFKKLVASIKDFPKMMELRPIVVDTSMSILGGNMRYRALSEAGYTEIPENWVKIADKLTEEEKKRFIIEDNMTLGEWDWDILGNNFEIKDLLEWGFDEKELKIEQEIEEDEAPEVSDEPAISKLGEVYQLGRHRLMCGDATNEGHVRALMGSQEANLVLTDPPYGISAVGKDGKTGGDSNTYRPVIGDDTDMDVSFLLGYAKKAIIWGGNYLAHYLPRGGRWLVWDKQRADGLGFSDCELAWTNLEGVIVVKYTVKWDGWRREEKNVEALHPTMKSVKMLTMVIKDYSEENDIIQDIFGGSGSTLIACEQTNRTCYMMELDPKYVDVIRKRYAKFIGKETEWETLTKPL